jgi:DNA-binding PadR family transcriptional regulator
MSELPGSWKGALYELFVLGRLMLQPMHGYKLHAILTGAMGPMRQISWGALYPLLRRLETEGLIAQDTQSDEWGDAGGRPRKAYRITEAGRLRFFALMNAPGQYHADFHHLLTVQIANFGHISLAEQRAILENYRGYVRYVQDYVLRVQQQFVERAPIPAPHSAHVLRALAHRLHLLHADLQWVDAELAAFVPEEERMAHPSG